MLFNDCVNNVSTFTDLKKFANEYVIDYKYLTFEELKAAVIKTAPQYSNEDKVREVVRYFELNPDRNIRILYGIFIKNVLLNCDDFTSACKDTDEKILDYEQDIVDSANEFKLSNEVENIDFYKYVVEAAWDENNDVSVDEQNLINKIRVRMRITEKQHQILEAQISKFPTNGNVLHTKEAIGNARKALQNKGFLISVRDSENIDYDVIPVEVAQTLRKIFDVDIKEASFNVLLDSKYVRSKSYLTTMLEKTGVRVPKYATLTELKELVIKNMSAYKLIGGYSTNDGLDKTTISNWCSSLNLNAYGTKPDLIHRIIAYYDDIKQITVSEEDEREILYRFYCELAARNLNVLHKQGVISKDLECEHKFEAATNYIFEKVFKIRPLIMNGTEHPDGILSFNDKLIMWDNKSKETEVSLSDHIKQFDKYIKNSVKPVSVFMVIGPAFTSASEKECAKYAMYNDTIILLITAQELKDLADKWIKVHGADNEPLPLGVFKQNGRFNPDLVML